MGTKSVFFLLWFFIIVLCFEARSRETERDRQRETERDRGRQRETERDRHTQWESAKNERAERRLREEPGHPFFSQSGWFNTDVSRVYLAAAVYTFMDTPCTQAPLTEIFWCCTAVAVSRRQFSKVVTSENLCFVRSLCCQREEIEHIQ